MRLPQLIQEARKKDEATDLWGVDYEQITKSDKTMTRAHVFKLLASIDPDDIKLADHGHLATVITMLEPRKITFTFEPRESSNDKGPPTHYVLIGIEQNGPDNVQQESRTLDESDLFKLLKDDDARKRGDAAYRLGDRKATNAGPFLIEALASDRDEHTRATSAWALSRIGATSAYPALIKALADPSMNVRIETISALGDLKDRRAIPHLIPFLAVEETRYDAYHALKAISGVDLGTDMKRWQAWWDNASGGPTTPRRTAP